MIHQELKQEILSKKLKKKHYRQQIHLNRNKKEDVVEYINFNQM